MASTNVYLKKGLAYSFGRSATFLPRNLVAGMFLKPTGTKVNQIKLRNTLIINLRRFSVPHFGNLLHKRPQTSSVATTVN